jgi:glycosyltransferase involved in cell wall biosynthesis
MSRNTDRIRVVIIASNEESRIERAVRSGLQVGPVTVVDGGSRDRTCDRAGSAGAEIILNPWPGFAAQRRFAIEQVREPWMLFLDADEEVTRELADAIRALDLSASPTRGFRIRRRSRFLGRWMRHGAWGRDAVLRLFRRDSASVADRLVHEEVSVPGPVGELDGFLLHYAQDDFETVGRKFAAYVPLMAEEIAKRRIARGAGASIGLVEITLRAKLSFARDYFLRAGFLDGWQGFVLAFWGSASVVAKYAEARRILELRDAKP